MKKLFTYLFSVIAFVSTTKATQQIHNDIEPIKCQKTIQTQSGEANIYLPAGLDLDEDLFKQNDKEEIPYIFENLSIDFYNQEKFEQASLNAVASIWNGNKNYDFITELEDHNPGIVDLMRRIKNNNDFKSVMTQLSAH
ncbi:MAG: hypothetical protein ACRYGR_02545 [Janthinobacterium lividum]